MTSRRLIRIKVLQMLYAYSKADGVSLIEIEKKFGKSIDKSVDLYYLSLSLILELEHLAYIKIDNKKHRNIVTEEDLNPNMKFCENAIIEIIKNNNNIQSEITNRKINLNADIDILEILYKQMIDSDVYKSYMSSNEQGFDIDKKFILELYDDFLFKNEQLYEYLEEKDIYWNDDFELVFSLVYKTISKIDAKAKGEDKIILSVYQNEDDLIFGKDLLRKTIINNSENISFITPIIRNWEIDRISDMDKLIISTAVTELSNFPSIPVKVTLDEYIDIAKDYSTAKSGSFINGILDKTLKSLQDKDLIKKTGRGLLG